MNYLKEESRKFHKIISEIIPQEVIELSSKCDEAYIQKNANLIKINISELKLLLQKYDNRKVIVMCVYYNIATSYSELRVMDNTNQEKRLENEILNFRQAINIYDEIEMHSNEINDKEKFFIKYIACRSYTNMGNSMRRIGRYIAAIDSFHGALLIHDNFAMASLNLSYTLYEYAAFQNKEYEHQYYLHAFYRYYQQAKLHSYNLEDPSYLDELEKNTIGLLNPQFVDEYLKKDLSLPNFTIDSEKESEYRSYILICRLFLEPCLDILGTNCFAVDSLTLPFETEFDKDKNKEIIGLFNQMKFEFAHSRYLWYQTTVQNIPTKHFTEHHLDLIDMGDTAIFEYREFLLRLAYRSLYSIFDKIGLFLNEYFGVGLKGRDISFKNIWKDNLSKKKIVPRPLTNEKDNNVGINALYWLQKDLVEFEGINITSPFSVKMCDLRNNLEHNSVRTTAQNNNMGNIRFTKYVQEVQLEECTYKLMKLLREAIIYLVIAVNEKPKSDDKDNIGLQ